VPSLRRQRVEPGQPQYRVRPVQARAAAGQVHRPPFGGPAHRKAEETVMPFKPKINIKLVKCGTCGKSYNNPLNHTCRIGFSKTGQRRVTSTQKKGK
jgi:hypothetical protein